MNRKVLRMGTVGLVAALLAALTIPAPAQASVGPNSGGAAVRVVAPLAPAGLLRSASGGAALASVPSPSISPTTNIVRVRPGGTYTCGVGNLCTGVWDPNFLWVDGQGGAQLGGWAIFYLYNCHEYAVSNWLGDGVYLDNQTPAGLRGVKSYFRNQFHNTIGSPITPDGTQHGPYDWDPVWYIKNC